MGRARAPAGRAVGATGPYAAAAAAVFLAPAVVGAAVGASDGAATVLPVREAGTVVLERPPGYFFGHNAPIALAMVAGAALGGLPTLFLLAYNGFLAGAVAAEAAAPLGPARTLALLVPHGVFELPALWLAGGAGLRWAHLLWKAATGDRDRRPVGAHLLRTVSDVAIVLALLAVAAVVEARVTVPLARALTG